MYFVQAYVQATRQPEGQENKSALHASSPKAEAVPFDLDHSRAGAPGRRIRSRCANVLLLATDPNPQPRLPEIRHCSGRLTATTGNKSYCFCLCLIDHISHQHHHGDRVPSDWERRPCGKLASSMPHTAGSLPRPKGKHLLALCFVRRLDRARFLAGIPTGSIAYMLDVALQTHSAARPCHRGTRGPAITCAARRVQPPTDDKQLNPGEYAP